MAAFPGEDLVTITGPDGVQRQVPSSLANAFQGFAPAGPSAPVDDYAAGVPAPAVNMADPSQIQPGTELAPLPPDPSPMPAQHGVVVTPDGFPQQLATPAGFEQPAPKAKAVKAPKGAKPAGTQVPEGYGDVAAQAGAIDQGYDNLAQTKIGAADVAAAGDALMADEMEGQYNEINKAAAKREADAQANIAEQQKTTDKIMAFQKKLENTKIDRKVDHPILALVGQLLAVFGQAYDRKDGPNPATVALMQALDRKVAGQMGNYELLKDALGFKKDDLARAQELGKNTLAMNNAVVGSLAERAARHLEVIAKRTSSDTTRANALAMAQETRLMGADKKMEALKGMAEAAQRDRQHKAQIGLGYAGISAENQRQKNQLAQNQLFHDQDADLKREQIQAEKEAALAKIRAEKGDAGMKQAIEMDKLQSERGIGNASTGEALLTGEGYQMLDKADQLEKRAAQLEQSGAMTEEQAAQAKMLHENALALRGEAKMTKQFLAGSGEAAEKMREKYTATQSAVSLAEDIINDTSADTRTFFSTGKDQAAIQAKRGQLMMVLKNAYQLGVLSKSDQKALEEQMGKDPTKWDVDSSLGILGAGTDPEAFKARLQAISSGLEGQFMTDMRAHRWNVSGDQAKLIFHKSSYEGSQTAKDASELKRGTLEDKAFNEENANDLTNGMRRMFYSAGQSADDRAADIRSGADKRYPGEGFDKKQADAMDRVLAEAKAGKTDTIAAFAQDPKLAPMVARVVQTALQNSNGDQNLLKAYDTIRKAAPDIAKSRDQAATLPSAPGTAPPQAVVRGAAKQAAVAQVPIMDLTKGAIAGAPGMYDELVKRAATGDKDAKTALQGYIQWKAKNAALPSAYPSTYAGGK